jgi:hypothetical protein
MPVLAQNSSIVPMIIRNGVLNMYPTRALSPVLASPTSDNVSFIPLSKPPSSVPSQVFQLP